MATGQTALIPFVPVVRRKTPARMTFGAGRTLNPGEVLRARFSTANRQA
jgi:hypothetical protein